ncbi:hypothetical protein JCM3766R1_003683 [Sporobolomyces carnicolor]
MPFAPYHDAALREDYPATALDSIKESAQLATEQFEYLEAKELRDKQPLKELIFHLRRNLQSEYRKVPTAELDEHRERIFLACYINEYLWASRKIIARLRKLSPGDFMKDRAYTAYKVMALSAYADKLFNDIEAIEAIIQRGGGPAIGSPQDFYEKQSLFLPDKPELRVANNRVMRTYGTVLGYEHDKNTVIASVDPLQGRRAVIYRGGERR